MEHTVKVTFENGDTIVTGINGSKEEIRDYYLHNYFNMTTYDFCGSLETMVKGTEVVFIDD